MKMKCVAHLAYYIMAAVGVAAEITGGATALRLNALEVAISTLEGAVTRLSDDNDVLRNELISMRTRRTTEATSLSDCLEVVDGEKKKTLAINCKTEFTKTATFRKSVKISDDLLVTKGNLMITNGKTFSTVNGKGNLVIGSKSVSQNGGSHNIVLGNSHTFSSYGGFVVGHNNTVSGPHSAVTGGEENTADGWYSAVSGGRRNTASGNSSTVNGGVDNEASGHYSAVSGGAQNEADGKWSTVIGGKDHRASNDYSIAPCDDDDCDFDTFDTLRIERNQASAALMDSKGLFQPLFDARVLVESGPGRGLIGGGAATMFSPMGKKFIRPYGECRDEAFGVNDGNYTKIVCDGYDRNMEVCELERKCIADDFEKIEYRATKGEYLSNTDDVLKLFCYESEDFSSMISSFGLTCDDVPTLSKENIEAAHTYVLQLQGAVALVQDGFSNELISFGKIYYPATDLDGDNNTTRAITIGDSHFAYSEAINGPKGFSTELVIKNGIISDYADYHVTSIEDIDPSATDFHFLNDVMKSYFSQKYSCRTYSDKEREQLSDFMQFYYGNECKKNLGTMLAVKYDDATTAFAALQILKTRSDGSPDPCNDCSCVSDDELLSAADTANTYLKSGKSARNVNGCAD